MSRFLTLNIVAIWRDEEGYEETDLIDEMTDYFDPEGLALSADDAGRQLTETLKQLAQEWPKDGGEWPIQ